MKKIALITVALSIFSSAYAEIAVINPSQVLVFSLNGNLIDDSVKQTTCVNYLNSALGGKQRLGFVDYTIDTGKLYEWCTLSFNFKKYTLYPLGTSAEHTGLYQFISDDPASNIRVSAEVKNHSHLAYARFAIAPKGVDYQCVLESSNY